MNCSKSEYIKRFTKYQDNMILIYGFLTREMIKKNKHQRENCSCSCKIPEGKEKIESSNQKLHVFQSICCSGNLTKLQLIEYQDSMIREFGHYEKLLCTKFNKFKELCKCQIKIDTEIEKEIKKNYQILFGLNERWSNTKKINVPVSPLFVN